MIQGAISNTGQGVELSGKVAHTLTEIVTKARQVDELASEVASATREQAQGIMQINTAVGQMDKVTQSNAANAEETAAASEELNAQAATMKQAVAELLELVGGTAAGKSAEPTARLKTVHAPIPVVQWPAAANGNGHIRRSRGVMTAADRRSANPGRSTALTDFK